MSSGGIEADEAVLDVILDGAGTWAIDLEMRLKQALTL
jgi:hypothetical protein